MDDHKRMHDDKDVMRPQYMQTLHNQVRTGATRPNLANTTT